MVVVESPVLPPEPDSRRLTLRTLVALVVGGLMAFFWLVAWNTYYIGASRGRGEILQFGQGLRDTTEDAKRFLRSLLSAGGTGQS